METIEYRVEYYYGIPFHNGRWISGYAPLSTLDEAMKLLQSRLDVGKINLPFRIVKKTIVPDEVVYTTEKQ